MLRVSGSPHIYKQYIDTFCTLVPKNMDENLMHESQTRLTCFKGGSVPRELKNMIKK